MVLGMLWTIGACSLGGAGPNLTDHDPAVRSTTSTGNAEEPAAQVREVTVSGPSGNATFAVTVASDDRDCSQYADWWEVLTPSGELVYRRILTHSHASEQPFTRTGGPVPVQADDVVVVRAHLHPAGYGGDAMKGTIASGFSAAELASSFAADIEDAQPQPDGCLF